MQGIADHLVYGGPLGTQTSHDQKSGDVAFIMGKGFPKHEQALPKVRSCICVYVALITQGWVVQSWVKFIQG